jgi:haloalkane dehalogenase
MKDWVFDRAFLESWTSRFPNARVERFADCGHFLLEDAPLSLVRMIADFLGAPVRA